jgi:DNA-binding Lrp family transcriptional regulator
MNELDQTDARIITLLQNNARLSNKELAAQIGLAPSSCSERVRRLQASGVFTGFHAEVDPKALSIHLQAFVAIRLSQHAPSVLAAFKAHILAFPEVVALYHIAGANDYLLHVAVRGTDHLRDLLGQITTQPDVAHIETALIFEYTRNPELPNFNPDSSE